MNIVFRQCGGESLHATFIRVIIKHTSKHNVVTVVGGTSRFTSSTDNRKKARNLKELVSHWCGVANN